MNRSLAIGVTAAALVLAAAGSAMAQSYSFNAKIRAAGEYEFSPAVVVPNPSGLTEVIVAGNLTPSDRRDEQVTVEGGLLVLLAPGEEDLWPENARVQIEGNWWGKRLVWGFTGGLDVHGNTPDNPFARGGPTFCNNLSGKTVRGYIQAITAAGNYGWSATWQ
jgi:hypothetical protein